MTAVFNWHLSAVALLALCVVSLLPHPVSAQPQKDLALTLVSDSYYVEARAGRDTRFHLEVRNTGGSRLTDIALSSDWPEGWAVAMDPARIASLDRGAVETVSVSIRPPATVTKGEYAVRFIAASGDLRTVQTVQVRVASASYWLWVGIGSTLVVIAVFIVIFLRMGRRG